MIKAILAAALLTIALPSTSQAEPKFFRFLDRVSRALPYPVYVQEGYYYRQSGRAEYNARLFQYDPRGFRPEPCREYYRYNNPNYIIIYR